MDVCEDESAPPSMPAAPVVVSWLDFLLDDTLLEKHLSQQEKPDPSAFELVIQFLSNATELPSPGSSTPGNGPPGGLEGPASGEPGNCSPEHETANRKSLPLKLLALKAAAFLGWNLDLFEQKLPLTMQQTLINELQKAVDCTELLGDAKEEVGPDAAFALGLRCRWVLRTAVRSRIPVRSAKGIALQLPGQVDPTQVAPEVADAITKACEEECEAASSFLERLLSERWPVRVPTIATFAVLKREEPPSQSHHWDRGVMASQDDLSCQISYELGAFHFYKERYQQAAERFESALRLYSKLKQAAESAGPGSPEGLLPGMSFGGLEASQLAAGEAQGQPRRQLQGPRVRAARGQRQAGDPALGAGHGRAPSAPDAPQHRGAHAGEPVQLHPQGSGGGPLFVRHTDQLGHHGQGMHHLPQ